MRKLALSVMAVAVLVSAVAAPAGAAKKPTTLYLHGTEYAGEVGLTSTWLEDNWMRMDTSKPTDSAPKSMFVTNYVGGPNTSCSGNGLLPTWRGDFKGKIKGLTLNLHTIATPAAQLKVDVYPDGTGGCDSGTTGASDYVPPAATETVDVAPGHSETVVKFNHKPFKAYNSLVLMLSIVGPSPAQVRVLYDSTDMASNLQVSK